MIEFVPVGRIHWNGEDVTDLIRGSEVSSAASKVAAARAVRAVLVEKQRRLGETEDDHRQTLDLMRSGGVQTGHVRDLVFAAAPLQLPNSRTGVIVLSQEANAGLGPAARYFALAAILTFLRAVVKP